MTDTSFSPPTIPDPEQVLPPVVREGDLLVVRSGSVLNDRCVKTNQPVADSEIVTRSLYWCSPTALVVLIVLLGPLAAVVLPLFAKKCRLTFKISAGAQPQHRLRKLVSFAATIGSIVALAYGVSIESRGLAISGGVALALSIGSVFRGQSPLKIVKHDNGLFAIKGCSNEYLSAWKDTP